MTELSRRHALAATATFALAARASAVPGPTPTDTGSTVGGKVAFPNWRSAAEAPSPPPPQPLPPEQRIGFAVIALGRLSLEQILPAFAQSRAARPVALVSGTPEKLTAVAAQQGIAADHTFGYDQIGRLRDFPDVRAVYVVSPNALHRAHVEAAAAAGKHVLCEKPMSVSSADARAMVAACDRARVKLMIAYRAQYEPHLREVIRIARSGELGTLKAIEATNVQANGSDPAALAQWRYKRALAGGGSLPDVGLYCLNIARAITGEEPQRIAAHVYSTPGDPRFSEVEETVAFQIAFPSGVQANCLSSYGAFENRRLALHFDRGTVEVANAFGYDGQQLYRSRREPAGEGRDQITIPTKNQFSLEIDHFTDCIMNDRRPHTPGEEGVADHEAMEAIYRAAREGRTVTMALNGARDGTRGPLA